MRLTRHAVAALRLPVGKPYKIVWDDGLPGFGMRINPTGKVWVVQYRTGGKSRRQTIGRADAVTLDAARESAKRTLARVQLGADPYAERLEAEAQRSVTFGKVAERYLRNSETRLKPRSYEEVSRHLQKHWAAFHQVPLHMIDRSSIAERLEEIAQQNGPIASNRARAAASAMFAYALGMGLADTNPVVGTLKSGEEVRREHVLSDGELTVIWNSCGTSDYGRVVRMLMLTGQRREEVGNMRWPEVDIKGALWTIPAHRTKNRRAHEVHLSNTTSIAD